MGDGRNYALFQFFFTMLLRSVFEDEDDSGGELLPVQDRNGLGSEIPLFSSDESLNQSVAVSGNCRLSSPDRFLK